MGGLQRDNWPRTDHRHVATEDVPKLRELVNAAFAQKGAEPRDAWIDVTRNLEVVTDVLMSQVLVREYAALSAGLHRPEFQAIEVLAVSAEAAMGEEHGAVRIQLNGD